MRGGVCVQLTGTCVQVHLPPCLGPWPLTSGAQGYALAIPKRRLPTSPVCKIPRTPINPAIVLPQTLEKREAGSEGGGPGTQRLGLLKVP